MIFPSKIKRQLFLVVSVPLIFVITSVSAFILFDSLDNVNKDIDIKGRYITEQASLLTEFYFYTGDIENINSIAELMINTNDLNSIKFYDSSDRIIALKEKHKPIEAGRIFKRDIYSKNTKINDFSPLEEDPLEERLGYVEINLSDISMISRKDSIYLRMLLVATLGIIVGLLLTYLFSRKLIFGLNSLRLAALSIEQKNFSQRCAENSTGELLKIQKVFNNMAESIELNEKSLQDKIASATETLNNTIDELSLKNIELDKTRQQTIELERSKAISDERDRIMKDMHDGIGGQLVASLALIEKEQESEIRSNISEILTHCLDDFRLIINSLNINSNILIALMADFKYRMQKRLDNMDIRLNWQIDESIDDLIVQPQQGLHILRILQEAFSNILKHAHASHINFYAYKNDSHVIISINDDGQFKLSKPYQGIGIKNMKWRAQQIGANFKILKNATAGCQIILSIPMASFSTQ